MSQNQSLEKILLGSKKAILIGIGGGGDIVGTLPTARLLELFNIEYILGGLPWERSVIDPLPGPRKFEEINNAKKLNETIWIANKDTMTFTNVRFAESGVSEILEKETLLVDINQGPDATVEGLLDASKKLQADLIIGIDVGGDAVAFGNEKGIASPLADSIMTAALYKLSFNIPTIMGIFGFGSDGELSLSELESSFKTISQNQGLIGSWGITPETKELMEKVMQVVPTEASKMPVEYSKGKFKSTFIRSGTRRINLNLSSTVTFYLDPNVVFERVSKTARTVSGCKNLLEANKALNEMGLKTELDLEHEKLKAIGN